MRWRVKYLLKYSDINRWGESVAYGRANAMVWVEAAKTNKDFLEVCIMHGPREIGRWKRDVNGRLQRVWSAV